MYKKDLDQYLKTSTPQASLLYGEGEFWIGFYSKIISSRLASSQNTMTFYFGDYQFNQIHEMLAQSSLFGDETLIVLKIDKKISKKEIQAFLQALSKNPSHSLIIEFYQSEAKSVGEYTRDCKEMAAVFRGEKVVEVRFFAPTLNESQNLLSQKVQELGVKTHSRVLLKLLELQNFNVAIALKEVEKFALLQREITEHDVDELCSALGSFGSEDLIAALLKRDHEVLKIYARLEEEGLNEMGLLNAMGNYFYRLFLIFVYLRAYGKFDAREVLGYAPPLQVQNQLVQEASALREKQYQEIFEVILCWREEIFMGKNKGNFAICALNKIQGILR